MKNKNDLLRESLESNFELFEEPVVNSVLLVMYETKKDFIAHEIEIKTLRKSKKIELLAHCVCYETGEKVASYYYSCPDVHLVKKWLKDQIEPVLSDLAPPDHFCLNIKSDGFLKVKKTLDGYVINSVEKETTRLRRNKDDLIELIFGKIDKSLEAAINDVFKELKNDV